MNKKNNNKGFTLAELLIVVAIIAVLVAIAIPVFTTQLERSKEATDAANIRGAYAEVMATAMTAPQRDWSTSVSLKQQKSGWQNSFEIAGVAMQNASAQPTPNGKIDIVYHAGVSGGSDAYITIAGTSVAEQYTVS